MKISPIHASSDNKDEIYRLLNMVHVMAASMANSPRKEFWLARTNSDTAYGPIVTVWTNGIVDIGARTYKNEDPVRHEYFMVEAKK